MREKTVSFLKNSSELESAGVAEEPIEEAGVYWSLTRSGNLDWNHRTQIKSACVADIGFWASLAAGMMSDDGHGTGCRDLNFPLRARLQNIGELDPRRLKTDGEALIHERRNKHGKVHFQGAHTSSIQLDIKRHVSDRYRNRHEVSNKAF